MQVLRKEFLLLLSTLSNRRWVFVDESGCQLGMDRRYARASGGGRAHCTKPYHRGERFNLIGALGISRLRCMMSVNGSVNADVLAMFTARVLGPKLRKDDVVIWDNLSAHKVKRVTDAIEARGAKVIFLPPYSPDLNPIELFWSKLKTIIRRFAPRTPRAFQRALKVAINGITETDIRGWFKHCRLVVQSG